MRYVPPYGMETVPDAPYINGDPTIGRRGSIPPANAFEHPMRELVGVIEKSGIFPSELDLLQVAQGVRSQYMNYADDHGTADNLQVDYDPHITVYTLGLTLRVRVRFTNTSGARINAGAGWARISRTTGLDVIPGDLPAGGIATLVYDGTSFQLINAVGVPGTITIQQRPIPYTVDLSNTANYIDAQFAPPIIPTEMQPGLPLLVKTNNTIVAPPPGGILAAPGYSGYPAIRVNSNAPIPIYSNGHGAMYARDIQKNDVKLFVLATDPQFGTAFWITPNYPIRKFGEVWGYVRRDAIGGPQMDGLENTPQRAFRSIREAFYEIGSRYAPSPQLSITIILGQRCDAANDLYEGALIGPYGGHVTIIGGGPALALSGTDRVGWRIGFNENLNSCIEATACSVHIMGCTLVNYWPRPAFSHLISRGAAKVLLSNCQCELRTIEQNGAYIWCGEGGFVGINPQHASAPPGTPELIALSIPPFQRINSIVSAWGGGTFYGNMGMEWAARTRFEFYSNILTHAGYTSSQLSFIHHQYTNIVQADNLGPRWNVVGNSIIQSGGQVLPGNVEGSSSLNGIYIP